MTEDRSLVAQPVDVDTDTLRKAIQDEYKEVAKDPDRGFHFHTGREHFRLEDPGKPSRWNTLRALRVLAWAR